MEASAVAGLAVGVDGAAVPDGLQGVDGARHHTTRGLAIGRGDEAHAAGVALELGAIGMPTSAMRMRSASVVITVFLEAQWAAAGL